MWYDVVLWVVVRVAQWIGLDCVVFNFVMDRKYSYAREGRGTNYCDVHDTYHVFLLSERGTNTHASHHTYIHTAYHTTSFHTMPCRAMPNLSFFDLYKQRRKGAKKIYRKHNNLNNI
mmetsp:Transcript_24347/g.53299  ORF Transcript_24347/g.53299 Transcript_24347/m.53299 type:complete len:117 (-) Transcript_24347:413-763(-)